MGATQSGDVAFVPKVWSDHIVAHFDRKMAIGSLALINKELEAAPGETVNFPYWKMIGDVQEPAENEGLEVDSLQDGDFSVTVKETGKAVGWKDKAIRKAAYTRSEAEEEAMRQMGLKFGEKVDKDLCALLEVGGNYEAGFVAGVNTDVMTAARLLEGKVLAFGDKHDQAIALAIHSLCFIDLMKDTGTNFLTAQATDPMFGLPGFQGRLLGQALFTLDSMPRVADINGKKAYAAYSFKPNPVGIYMAQDLHPEKDRDILHRENIVAATMWYGVCSLHAKVATTDKRTARHVFSTSQNV